MIDTDQQQWGTWISIDPWLQGLLVRLEEVSLEPRFLGQRQLALRRALQPYQGLEARSVLAPLTEEMALARLYLYADFLPEDGQTSLIEQVRDLIEVHVPEEERAWLDSLRHSSMDLLEVCAVNDAQGRVDLQLRSLGDSRLFHVRGIELGRPLCVGQVLLTRLVVRDERPVLPGTAVLLAGSVGRAVFDSCNQERRELEALAGSFELGEWAEFTKRFGHTLLWSLAQTRLAAVVREESRLCYRTPDGAPVLYAVALYDHHECTFLSNELDALGPWQRVEGGSQSAPGGEPGGTWGLRADGSRSQEDPLAARLAVTASQLMVECDSRERLDSIKHQLASTFGFSLHFRGESLTPPAHLLIQPNVAEEDLPARTIVVTADEDHRLLSAFLESIYLEWADRPSPALNGCTPRHAAAAPATRDDVARLIDEVERNDLARRRTGKPGYDYNQLRTHVGL